MANEDWEEALRRIEEARAEESDMLDLSGMRIDRLPETIADLTRLHTLSLGHTEIADCNPLAALTNLRHLTLSYTRVADCGPLGALTNLQNLGLSNTQITDCGPLAALTDLQTLRLFLTPVADYTPLTALNKLELLSLDNLWGTDFRPLLNLPLLLEPAWSASRQVLFPNAAEFPDPAIEAAMAHLEPEDRRKALLGHLRSLPPWPEPLRPPPEPTTGEPVAPSPDPHLPVVWTDEGLDLKPADPVTDAITEAALEDCRDIITLLARKANQHDDLRRLTERAKTLLADPEVPPDPLRLHLVYQALRRLHAGHRTRLERFDDETVSALDALQDCVPGVTLSSPEVQALLQRQRDDRERPAAGLDRAREEAVLRAITQDKAPVAPNLKAIAEDVLDAPLDDDLGASRKWLSRETVITALKIAAAGSVPVLGWVLTQSPEIQSLAASIGDDAYWWATRIIDKLRAFAEARALGP